MAATGFTPVYIYASGTTGNIPSASNLTNTTTGSEIALNYFDGKLFYKNSSNSVVTVPLLQSSGSQNGWLSSTDWTTFNNKAPAFTYTTGYIPFGQGTTTPNQSANLFWDTSNARLCVGTTSSVSPLTVFYAAANDAATNAVSILRYGTTYGSAIFHNYNTTTNRESLHLAVSDGGSSPATNTLTKYMMTADGGHYWYGSTTSANPMTLFASGGVSIGNTTDPGAKTLSVNTATWSGPPASPKIWTTGGVAVGDSSNWVQLYQYGAYFNTSFYVVNTTPTGVYINSGSTAWSAYSDARLKTVTGKYETPLADINQLEPVKFTWNWDESKKPAVGLLAQSVEKVVPEAIDHAKLQNTDDQTEYMSVRYSELIPLLVASIQELQAKLKAAGVAGF